MTTLTGYPVLTWTKRNQKNIEGTRIYRSVGAPLDPNALPAPYDFLEGSQDYYIDKSVFIYNTYYYMIGVYDKEEEKLSSGMIEITIGKELMKPVNITSEYYKNDVDNSLDGPVNITSDYEKNSYAV